MTKETRMKYAKIFLDQIAENPAKFGHYRTHPYVLEKERDEVPIEDGEAPLYVSEKKKGK